MSEITVSPVRLDTYALMAKAGGILRAHLTQEERERLARLLVAAVWQKNPKTGAQRHRDPSADPEASCGMIGLLSAK